MSWTLFVFVGAYPWKSEDRKPSKRWVFVDSQGDDAQDRFKAETGFSAQTRGFTFTKGMNKRDAFVHALWYGYIVWPPNYGFRGTQCGITDDAFDAILADSRVQVIEQLVLKPNQDGEYCYACGNFDTFVKPNNLNGTYTCPGCRQPSLNRT